MNLVFTAVASINVVAFVLALLLNLHVFDDEIATCEARFGDQALVLASIAALVLTTPWNFVITHQHKTGIRESNNYASPGFLIFTSVPLTLLLVYLSIIVLALNGNELIADGSCPSTNGRQGAYSALVWPDVFVFLHTVVLTFHAKYQQQ